MTFGPPTNHPSSIFLDRILHVYQPTSATGRNTPQITHPRVRPVPPLPSTKHMPRACPISQVQWQRKSRTHRATFMGRSFIAIRAGHNSAPRHGVRYIGQEGVEKGPASTRAQKDERATTAPATNDSRRAARVPLAPRALSKLAIDGLLLRLSSLLTPLRHGGARGGPCTD